MSDEFENQEVAYSAFWPVLILVAGLLVWSTYQVYAANSQRSQDAKQLEAEVPNYSAAQNVANKYVALMKDLVATAQKDPAASAIVKDAIQAGLIHVQPNGTNGATTPVEPTANK